jgi:hypothetical protein
LAHPSLAPAGAARGTPRRPIARAVLTFDNWLHLRRGRFEYASNRACIFRIEVVPLDRAVVLSDGTTLAEGDRVVQVHLVNTKVPTFPAAGATLQWARRMNRCVDQSLRDLARYLAGRHDLGDIRAVRGEMTFGTAAQTAQLLRICARFGFRPAMQPRVPPLLTRLHRLAVNAHIALLVFARNPRGLRLDCLRRSRADVYLPRGVLEDRYLPHAPLAG